MTKVSLFFSIALSVVWARAESLSSCRLFYFSDEAVVNEALRIVDKSAVIKTLSLSHGRQIRVYFYSDVYETPARKISKKFLSQIENAVIEISNLMPASFRVPEKVKIVLNEDMETNYNDDAKVIRLPISISTPGQVASRARIVKYILAYFSHEFSHQFLNANLLPGIGRNSGPESWFSELLNGLNITNSNATYPFIVHEMLDLRGVENSDFVDELRNRLYEISKNRYSQISSLEYKKTRAILNHIIRPYDELFADLVTVLYFNDPKILYDSLKYAWESDDVETRLQARDFSATRSLTERDLLSTLHTRFFPVRKWIFENVLVKSPSDAEKSRIIEALATAIVKEIATLFGQTDMVSIRYSAFREKNGRDPIDPKEIFRDVFAQNQRLVERFSREYRPTQ